MTPTQHQAIGHENNAVIRVTDHLEPRTAPPAADGTGVFTSSRPLATLTIEATSPRTPKETRTRPFSRPFPKEREPAITASSERLADLRFREFRNQTILDAITEARLGEVKRLLAASDERIGQIAFKCGFSNPNYLKILFKRHVGSSMRDYRKSLSSVSREIAPDSP